FVRDVDLRRRGCGLAPDGLLLRARHLDLLTVRGELALEGANLFVLRLDLIAEHAVVALGLIELLRGGGLLREQPTGAVVAALGDLLLRDQRIALGLRRITLGDDHAALRIEALDLLPALLRARLRGGALRGQLIALQRQL